jgi:hypothetical protein
MENERKWKIKRRRKEKENLNENGVFQFQFFLFSFEGKLNLFGFEKIFSFSFWRKGRKEKRESKYTAKTTPCKISRENFSFSS